MKTAALKLVAGVLALSALQTTFAEARGYDRGRGGGGRGGYSSECQDAIANVRYCQGEVARYQALYNSNLCGADAACKYQQAQALQYTIQQLQEAESQRARACN